MHPKLAAAMIDYDRGDRVRINHFLKVHAYAAAIGAGEGLDESTRNILETAAMVHDIGIRACMRLYGRADGPLQEREGPPIAREMLRKLGLEADLTERVCYLVAHHHTYTGIDGPDYQILVEADFLVNLDEGKADAQVIRRTRETIFKTPTGIRFLEDLFPEAFAES